VIKAFEEELTDYKTTSSTIQFPLDKPLPADLIYRIAKYRVKKERKKVSSGCNILSNPLLNQVMH